jgi:phosphoglycerate dehydrogenase-like enzyme
MHHPASYGQGVGVADTSENDGDPHPRSCTVPKLSVAMTPARAADVCSEPDREWLTSHFEVRWGSAALDAAELRDLTHGADVVLTSWGTPQLSADMLVGDDRPKVVAHAAGSVKNLIEPGVLDEGVVVFSAATRIAASVGEYCLGAALALLRRLPQYDARLRRGEWKPKTVRGSELAGRTVGIVGASSTARALIRLLEPFGVDLVVHDPYLSDEQAASLGARLADLAEVTQADIVSLHVPDVPSTRNMITAELIRGMRDGTILINSSRGTTIDNDALHAELVAGRLYAALDVFAPEPPVLPQEVLASPNVLLTPHIAGDTTEGHLALTRYVMADVVRWLEEGVRGPSFVNPALWSIAA